MVAWNPHKAVSWHDAELWYAGTGLVETVTMATGARHAVSVAKIFFWRQKPLVRCSGNPLAPSPWILAGGGVELRGSGSVRAVGSSCALNRLRSERRTAAPAPEENQPTVPPRSQCEFSSILLHFPCIYKLWRVWVGRRQAQWRHRSALEDAYCDSGQGGFRPTPASKGPEPSRITCRSDRETLRVRFMCDRWLKCSVSFDPPPHPLGDARWPWVRVGARVVVGGGNRPTLAIWSV